MITLFELIRLMNRVKTRFEIRGIRDYYDYVIRYSNEPGTRNKCEISIPTKSILLPSIIDGDVVIKVVE